ncbi:MAG: VOC family protein [Burkholderiales bacterium]|nr:VOC family protein [Burkholderiales bacterium]
MDARANPICNLHHHAFACRDAEETRRFYEDLLGMPMVAAIQEGTHPRTGAPSAYLHLFFEMADGTCLAFFDYPEFFAALDAGQLAPRDSLVHHIALEVRGEAVIDEFRRRLEAHGVGTRVIDHGYCRSLYFVDPNGLKLELTTNVAGTPADFTAFRRDARATLARWQAYKAGTAPLAPSNPSRPAAAAAPSVHPAKEIP